MKTSNSRCKAPIFCAITLIGLMCLVGCQASTSTGLSATNAKFNLDNSTAISTSETSEVAKPDIGTKGIVNYTCRWPSSSGYAVLLKQDTPDTYCSQVGCINDPHDLVGGIPPGTKVTRIGGSGLSEVKVHTGHFANQTGFIADSCVDWGEQAEQNTLSGAPSTSEVSLGSGSLSGRQAFVKRTIAENKESYHYSGFHGSVTLQGPNGTTMVYFDPATSVTAVSGDEEFISNLRQEGFRQLIFKDGTAEGKWLLNLTKDPVIPVIQ